ncbi:glycosyltransferase family 4 protein [Saccharopolyspora thermophila]|uniref:glycosyltransferase family 4 protein n=1 Tax=Saccharopolyspora thermophila TaxID=89367 RepID=UPI001663F492|nr:glycosyltransferase family 4 protein [Saccharopolyspora subtropica]
MKREIDALVLAGHEVDVVCLKEPGKPAVERGPGLTIRRVPLRHDTGAGIVRLLFEYGLFFLLATAIVAALHARRRFDVVQVNSVPDALVFVALLPKLTGARVLLDVQEPMPEFFATRFGPGRKRPLVRLIAALERWSIRFADATITVTEPMRRTFVARGASAHKLTVVMDGADERVFDPDRFPRAERDPNRFVLISHCTIEPQYGLDTAIEAVALLAEEIPGLCLRIFGTGSQRAELRALAEHLGVADHVWFSEGFVPLDQLVAELAAADVGVVAMKRDPFRDLTLAGKMFDFIALGTPMVVSITTSVEETFGDGCFEPFESGNAQDLARALRRLHDEPELAHKYAQRASEVVRPLSWPVQRQRYLDVVAALGRS